MQRTHADWKDATEYSVFCSEHFTDDCFEEDWFIAARFGLTKRKCLKPDAVPTIFYSPLNIVATSHDHLQEGPSVSPSVGHKRGGIIPRPSEKEKAAFEKRERARVCSYTLVYMCSG